jgi:hypothetical protein
MAGRIFAVTVAGSLLLASPQAHAQGLLAKPTVQHVTVAAASSAAAVAAGASVTLWADVTPNPKVHVYAAGAKDFTPVALAPSPVASLRIGAPQYPKAELAVSPGSLVGVPAYTSTFRIAVPVTVAATAAPGSRITVAAALTYQACDDTLCYPAATAPVNWTVQVK